MNPISEMFKLNSRIILWSILLLTGIYGQEASSPDTASTSIIEPSSAEADTGFIDSVAMPYEEEKATDLIHVMDSDEVFKDHASTRFRLIVPVEGDVINVPSIEIVVALGKEAFSSVAILIDGFPLDNPVVTVGPLMTVKVNDLSHGIHKLSMVFLDEQSKILYKKEISFFIQLPRPERPAFTGKLKQSGVVFARSEYRGVSTINQVKGHRPFEAQGNSVTVGDQEDKILPQSNNILHTTYNLKYDKLEVRSRLSLNSQEDKYGQPFHRFGGRVSYGPWATLAGGDVYPHMNDLVLKDTRIRGGEAKLRMIAGETEWGNLHYTQGTTRREVEPHVLVYETESSLREDTIPGTFARKIAAARLGFGAPDQAFSFGITGMQTWDDGPDWDRLIFDNIPHYSPEENVAAGADFQLAFWKRKIVLFTDYALSLWTANRDAAILGSDDSRYDVSYSGIQPKDVSSFMVVNASTQVDPDNITRNHAIQSGVRVSLPFSTVNNETETMYYETGDYYRSEGNPFITTTGEKGIKVLQRIKLLENKLAMGAQGSYGIRELYTLDTSSNELQILNYKGDVRYSPHITLPGVWIGLSGNHSVPGNTGPTLSPKSEFVNQSLYLGGFQQFVAGPGRLHVGLNYSVTNYENKIYPSSINTGSQVTTFESSTNIIASSLQYRRTGSPLIPFVKYTLTSNSVRQPINNVSLGSTFAFSNRLSGFSSIEVGEYPLSNKENDLKVGESLSISYAVIQNHSLSFQERIFWNGPETDIIVGGNYEIYF